MTTPVKNPALRYYGAKFRLGRFIASTFPAHTVYVEPFGGAAGVLLRKPLSAVEIYNDMDGSLVNFFRVLRENRQRFYNKLRFTPYSREEYERSYSDPASDDPLEMARRYFIQAWQGYGGVMHKKLTGWKIQQRIWKESRANQLAEWGAAKKNVFSVARRFENVQIENDDALDVIKRFDTADTLFYCDPPYPKNTRNEYWAQVGYKHEFRPNDHIHLANLLHQIKGMAIVSTYPNPQYAKLYEGWTCLEKSSQTMNKTIATELIYFSPNCKLVVPRGAKVHIPVEAIEVGTLSMI